MSNLEKLSITGPVSITVIPESEELPRICCLILLLGTTGAGKSSFIEALGNDKTLGISKNQLDGFTQHLTVYKVNNIRMIEYPDSPIFIVDTPGFADRSLPESKMLRMVQDMMDEEVDFIDDNARVVKFENTHSSALEVLNDCLTLKDRSLFTFEHMVEINQTIAHTLFGGSLHVNLLERKSALLQRLKVLDGDLSDPLMESNVEYRDTLLKQASEAMNDLKVVEKELEDFQDFQDEAGDFDAKLPLPETKNFFASPPTQLPDTVEAVNPSPDTLLGTSAVGQVQTVGAGADHNTAPNLPSQQPPQTNPLKAFISKQTTKLRKEFNHMKFIISQHTHTQKVTK
ncbi:hypothetical protein CVT24_012044 [Panaeolus cyanescens]|uniref:G domain-containing protein n=1 Tax=Panaeolus cyanescens TaxID=181874 RepID=A0A409VYH9_9AGAR|nr:hypothetical protein CVT24_012044 [Panaeolus cyanescens]